MAKVTTKSTQIDRLNAALQAASWPADAPEREAAAHYAVIRAVVRACVPGNQRGKNLEPLMGAAIAAACRAIRRTKAG